MKKNTKKYPFFPTIFRMVKTASKYRIGIIWRFIAYSICMGAVPVLNTLFIPIIMREITSVSPIISNLLCICGGYFIIMGSLAFINSFVNASAQVRITKVRIDYLRDICAKFMGMEYRYMEDPSFLDEYELALNATNNHSEGVEGVYLRLFGFFATIFGSILLIIYVSTLQILALFAILLSVVVGYFTSTKVNKYRYKVKNELSRSSREYSYYKNVGVDFHFGKDLRIYDLGGRVVEETNRSFFGLFRIIRDIKNKEFGLAILELLSTLLANSVIYGLLIFRLMNGMGIAEFSGYLAGATALTILMRKIADDVAYLIYQGAYVADMYKYLDTDYMSNPGKLLALNGKNMEIEFRNVSFKYPKTEKFIYQNLNLHIKGGEKIAIVGANGAGKTTLVKLLTRLFEVTDGEILVNGIPIKEFDLFEYYKMFGVVFQEYEVGAFSVGENLALTSNYDPAKAEQALRLVGLWDKVQSFPKGLDQPLLKIIEEDGTELSGGETQKLGIARALYKNAPIVILDEPTSALDALAEAGIYQNFSELSKDKTAIFISHRLASTKFCDRILLFGSDGLIFENGTHDELMKLKGHYYDMFITQGKYYQEGENHDN